MLRAGTIDQREYGLLEFADTVEEAFARVRQAMDKHHLKLENGLEE
jgi:predicted RNase H-like HicB family nuclease